MSLHSQARALCEATLGPDHVETLKSRANLALAYFSAGRNSEAIKLHESTLKLMESKLAPDDPDLAMCRNNLAETYRQTGRLSDAISCSSRPSRCGKGRPRRTLEKRGSCLGIGPTCSTVVSTLQLRRLAEVLQTFERFYGVIEKSRGTLPIQFAMYRL